MATVQTSIQLFDGMSPVLRNITNTIHIVVSAFEDMAKASSQPFDTDSLHEARKQLNQAESELNQIEEAVERARREEEKFNQSVAKGKGEVQKLKKAWEKISGKLSAAGIATDAKEVLSIANDKKIAGNNLQAQTGMQGDGLDAAKQSVETLYIDNMGESMDDVAQSLSTVYQITGQTGVGLEQMTRAGILLRDTFGYDVTESMRTAEVMEKQFGVSGAQAFDLIVQGAQAGLDKNGDLLDTINEYSVQFRKLGFSSTEMFNMLMNGAQSGTFSVDKLGNTVKEFSSRVIDGSKASQEGFEAIGLDANKMAAAFDSGGDSAKQAYQQTFDAISKVEDPLKRNMAGINLFGTMWEDLGYEGVMALGNISGSAELTTQNLEELNSVKYDDATSALASLSRTINMGLAGVAGDIVTGLTQHMNDFTAGLQGDASQIQGIFGGIGLAVGIVGRAISDNWSIIKPIMWGVVTALALYATALLIATGAQLANSIVVGISSIATALHTAFTTKWTVAIFAETLAQKGLNAALLACPITWIIIGIIALIAIFYAVVAAVNHFTGTAYSATGLICGAFAVAGAFIWNTVIGVFNALIQSAWSILAEPFLGIIEWILNIMNGGFDSFGGAVANLIGQIISWFLSLGKVVTKIIDAIFGTDWTSGLSSLQESVGAWGKNDTAITWEKKAPEIGSRVAYGDIWKAGNDAGARFDKMISGAFDDIKNNVFGEDDGTIPDTWEGINSNTENTAGNTAAMADSMEMAEEELKSMRDMAEQEVINRFTTAELTVNMGGITNQVNSQMDLDGIGGYLDSVIFETLEIAAEGVY